MDMWSIGVCILNLLLRGEYFKDLPKDEGKRLARVADGTFVQGLVKELPSDKTGEVAKRVLFDPSSKNLLEIDPTKRMSMRELMSRGLMDDRETKTSFAATIRAETKKVAKHVDKRMEDLADHVDRAVEEGVDRTTEKVTEARAKK